MDRESVKRLRFDRRLQRRNGWLEPTEEQAHLESLPDVSDKMTTCADEEEQEEIPTAESQAPAAGPAPVATAGDFSTSSSFGGFRDEPGSN